MYVLRSAVYVSWSFVVGENYKVALQCLLMEFSYSSTQLRSGFFSIWIQPLLYNREALWMFSCLLILKYS